MVDLNILLPILIPLIGGGIGYMVDRAYKRSDARRMEMQELLKKQVAEAEAEKEEALRKLRASEARERLLWKQLVAAGIEPVVDIGGGDT